MGWDGKRIEKRGKDAAFYLPVINVLVTHLERHVVNTVPRLDEDTEGRVVAGIRPCGGRLLVDGPFNAAVCRADFGCVLVVHVDWIPALATSSCFHHVEMKMRDF
jgi:hypothetical protein